MTSPLKFLNKRELKDLAKHLDLDININNKKDVIIYILTNYIQSKKNNGSIGSYHIQGRRKYMEDRNFKFENSKYIISGIFDGHGGHECSTYFNNNFLKYFFKYLNKKHYKKNIVNILKTLVNNLNTNFLNNSNKTSGTTANIILIDKIEGLFYNLNIGDSRCIAYCNKKINKSNIKQISKDHNFNYKKEVQFVLSKGGFIEDDRLNGRLAMSRAFGDKELSNYIEYTPDIFYGNAKNYYYFVHGSDGLFDELSNSVIINCVNKLLRENYSLNKIAETLVKLAYKKGSSDNITCNIIYFPEIN
jgi:serine/threonine protein phosphatase PrpC